MDSGGNAFREWATPRRCFRFGTRWVWINPGFLEAKTMCDCFLQPHSFACSFWNEVTGGEVQGHGGQRLSLGGTFPNALTLKVRRGGSSNIFVNPFR